MTFDILILFHIILTFITEIDLKNNTREKNLKNIAKAYLSFHFYFDFFSTIPGLMIGENVFVKGRTQYRRWTYYLKVLRFFHIMRLFNGITSFKKRIRQQFPSLVILVENSFKIIR